MAWSASKIFGQLIDDFADDTDGIDCNADTFKAALYDNDITPDNTVSAANSAYNAGQWTASGNEVSDGTNWDSAGEPLTSVTSAHSAAVWTFDAADTPQGGASCTLADVFGCLVYSDTASTPVADQGLCYNYFGGTQSVTAGTFTVTWNSSGVCSIDVS